MFLPAILIPACASSSPAILMMYSAYKLNKHNDSIQPWYTPFPIWNQSDFPCPVLTVASLPAYRFLKRQVRWYSHIFQNFPQFIVIHTVKGFGIVNKAETDFHTPPPPGLSCFFDDPPDVGSLISGSYTNRVISLLWYIATNSLRKIFIICMLFLKFILSCVM